MKNKEFNDWLPLFVVLGLVLLILIAFTLDMLFDLGIKNSFVVAAIIGYIFSIIASIIV